ncbi:MAG TPA: DUF2007 domain-containing protein [Acidimicrobiia bacterium]|nr:DUF2007 domain-containing protein [Acidimicrobiia bacterium]
MSDADPSDAPFVKAGTLGDPTTARLTVALLESEGIPCIARGQVSGEFPVTMGRLAETELWVRAADLEEARRIIADAGDRGAEGSDPTRSASPVVAIAVGVCLALAVVLAALRLF